MLDALSSLAEAFTGAHPTSELQILDETGVVESVQNLVKAFDEAKSYSRYSSEETDLYSAFIGTWKELISTLELEAEAWASARLNAGDAVVFEMPCTDAFIMAQCVRKLVEFAVEDSPRGCLPLILSSLSDLLERIKYPLMHVSAVYEPIYRLVFVASRYERLIGRVVSLTSGICDLERAQYQRRVDVALVSFLRALWRKVAEDPAVIDFFHKEGGDEGGEERQEVELDLLSALLPLLGTAHAGSISKESLVTALRTHAPAVDFFVLNRTSLMQDCVGELARLWRRVVEASSLRARGSSSGGRGTAEGSGSSAPPAGLTLLVSPLKSIQIRSEERSLPETVTEGDEEEVGRDGGVSAFAPPLPAAFSGFLFTTPVKQSGQGQEAVNDQEEEEEEEEEEGGPRVEVALKACLRSLRLLVAVSLSASPPLAGTLLAQYEEHFLEAVLLDSLVGEEDDCRAGTCYLVTRRVLGEMAGMSDPAGTARTGMSNPAGIARTGLSNPAGIARTGLLGCTLSCIEARLCPGVKGITDLLFARALQAGFNVAQDGDDENTWVSLAAWGLLGSLLTICDTSMSALLLFGRISNVSMPVSAIEEEDVGVREELPRTSSEDREDDEDEDEDEDDGLDIRPLKHPLLAQIREGVGSLANLTAMCSYFDSVDKDQYQDSLPRIPRVREDADAACAKLLASGRVGGEDPALSEWSETILAILCEWSLDKEGQAEGLLGAVLALLRRFNTLPYCHQVMAAGMTDKAGVRLVELFLAISSIPSSSSVPPTVVKAAQTAVLTGTARLYIAVERLCTRADHALYANHGERDEAVAQKVEATRSVLGGKEGTDSPCAKSLERLSPQGRQLLERAVLAHEMKDSLRALLRAGAGLGVHAGLNSRRLLMTGEEEEEEEGEEEEEEVIPLEPGLLADLQGDSAVSTPAPPRHALGSPNKDKPPPHSNAGIEHDFFREFEEVQAKLDHLSV